MSNAAQQVTAGIRIAAAVAEAIRDLGSVPSGHLYARLMGHMDLDTYNKVIGVLKQAKLVEEKNHLLTWVGPAK
jgi:hypothetical protein